MKIQWLPALAVAAFAMPAAADDSDLLLPPDAKPGECYARVLTPATYENTTEQVLKRAASNRIEVAPAKHEWTKEKVLVKEATSRLEIIPATYGWVEEQVEVQPAVTSLVEIPAEYGYEEEQVLVRAAHTVWKKGRGPIEKVDNGTGEIMCLVEVPAEYNTVRRRVVVSPAGTEERTTPARFETVKRRVQETPPSTRTIEIPAEYKMVKVRKQVAPATQTSIEIPAEYDVVTKRVKVSDGKLEWRPVLCETNINGAIVRRIQEALASQGLKPGPIDGRLGRETLTAVSAFQRAQGLPTGGLTIETIRKLGVAL